MIGWGVYGYEGQTGYGQASDILQEVIAPIVDDDHYHNCGIDGYNGPIICSATYDENDYHQTGHCMGDSGGPWINLNVENPELSELIGIVSWISDDSCGPGSVSGAVEMNSPVTYSNPDYRIGDWIENVISVNSINSSQYQPGRRVADLSYCKNILDFSFQYEDNWGIEIGPSELALLDIEYCYPTEIAGTKFDINELLFSSNKL